MITRGSGEIDWYSYDLPSKIDDLSDSSYAEFWYGPDRSRIKQYQSSGVTIRYAGTEVRVRGRGDRSGRERLENVRRVPADSR